MGNAGPRQASSHGKTLGKSRRKHSLCWTDSPPKGKSGAEQSLASSSSSIYHSCSAEGSSERLGEAKSVTFLIGRGHQSLVSFPDNVSLEQRVMAWLLSLRTQEPVGQVKALTVTNIDFHRILQDYSFCPSHHTLWYQVSLVSESLWGPLLSPLLLFMALWPVKKSYSPCLLSILYTLVALSHSSIFLLLESLSWRIYIFIPFLCKDVHKSRSSRFLLSLQHKPSIWLWTLVIRFKHYNMCKMLRSMTDTVINVSFIMITSLSS